MPRSKWAEAPPATRRQYDWKAIAAELRKRPDEWKLVAVQANRSIRSAIKRQRINALKDPEWIFDVQTRNTHGQLADIWMSARPRTEEEKKTWDSRL